MFSFMKSSKKCLTKTYICRSKLNTSLRSEEKTPKTWIHPIMNIRLKQGCDRKPNIFPECFNIIKQSSNAHGAGCKPTPSEDDRKPLWGGGVHAETNT